MTANPRGPGVRLPPPFIFAAAYLVSWWLDRRLTFEIDGAGAGFRQTLIGMAGLAAGLGLMGWGLVTFIYARTPVVPTRPARQLVRWGPYRYSRNPMYVGITAAYVGLALVTNMAWPLVFLPVALAVLAMSVIAREEQYLRDEFGAEYEDYCRRVRRWI
jgi:protein-S-isoprenylcysteine O-methyltransferase Ste14